MKQITFFIIAFALVSNAWAQVVPTEVQKKPAEVKEKVATEAKSGSMSFGNFKGRDKLAPVITLISPKVMQSGDKVTEMREKVRIVARVTDNDTLGNIHVNGQLASNIGDLYEIEIPLPDKENKIVVKASDKSGNIAELSFFVIKEIPAALAQLQAKEDLDFDIAQHANTAKYYALIIGVDQYDDEAVVDLDNPVKDAASLAEVLSNQYTFEKENVIFLSNPTRSDIVKAFDNLSNKLTTTDNLLIFYAGHGIWEEKLKKGYWLPADAKKEDRANWFSNSDLRDYIGGISTKHTLLVADACFSGGIFKTREAFANAPIGVKNLYQKQSREAMTSGALKSVPDESVFIKYLVKKLQENKDKFMTSTDLFLGIKNIVMNNSKNGQTPLFGEIGETGDEDGDFIFIKK